MAEDVQIELGWGFYLIILPLIITISIELIHIAREKIRNRKKSWKEAGRHRQENGY